MALDQANGRVAERLLTSHGSYTKRAPLQLIQGRWVIRSLVVAKRCFLAYILPGLSRPIFFWTFCFRFFGASHPVETPLGLKHSIASLGFRILAEILSIAMRN